MVQMYYLSDDMLWNAVFETWEEFLHCLELGMYSDVTIVYFGDYE